VLPRKNFLFKKLSAIIHQEQKRPEGTFSFPVGKVTMIFSNTGVKNRLFSIFGLIFLSSSNNTTKLKSCVLID